MDTCKSTSDWILLSKKLLYSLIIPRQSLILDMQAQGVPMQETNVHTGHIDCISWQFTNLQCSYTLHTHALHTQGLTKVLLAAGQHAALATAQLNLQVKWYGQHRHDGVMPRLDVGAAQWVLAAL